MPARCYPSHTYNPAASTIAVLRTRTTRRANRNGLARATQTMRGLDWFEVPSVRGHLADGVVAHFQVTMKVGFRLEDS